MGTETWKPVEGYEEYEVSDMGKVRRILVAKNNHVQKTLKPRNNGRGYLYVALYKQGERVNKAVHILVAQAFIPNPLNLPEVNHKKNKADNRATQLEWRSLLGHKQDQSKRGQKGTGVNYRKEDGKWQARYCPTPGTRRSLGSFSTKEEAKIARNLAVQTLPRIE